MAGHRKSGLPDLRDFFDAKSVLSDLRLFIDAWVLPDLLIFVELNFVGRWSRDAIRGNIMETAIRGDLERLRTAFAIRR